MVAADKDTVDPRKFIPVPPASEGGFDLIQNGNNFLSLRVRYLRVRYRKFHYETAGGESIPLEDCCLPQHFQFILKPLSSWGFWDQTVSIKKWATMFDHEQRLYSVTMVFDGYIEAPAMFSGNQPIAFHDPNAVIAAIARKQGVDVLNQFKIVYKSKYITIYSLVYVVYSISSLSSISSRSAAVAFLTTSNI